MAIIEETTPPQKDAYDEFIEIIIEKIEKAMRNDLGNITADFLENMKSAKEEKLKAIYEEFIAEFKKELESKQVEIEYAHRIINIQATLLSKIMEDDKESVLRVLHNVNLSEDELELLSGKTKIKEERS